MITGEHIKNVLAFLCVRDILSELKPEKKAMSDSKKTKVWENTIAELMKANVAHTSAPMLANSVPYGVFYSPAVEAFHKKIKSC